MVLGYLVCVPSPTRCPAKAWKVMAIVVIEEGAPNGTDLVVSDSKVNPIAQAKARGEQIVQVASLGDGFAILGLSLEPVVDNGKLTAFVVVNGCKPSLIAGIDKVVKVAIGKVGEIDVNGLKSRIAEGLGETWEPVPEQAQ